MSNERYTVFIETLDDSDYQAHTDGRIITRGKRIPDCTAVTVVKHTVTDEVVFARNSNIYLNTPDGPQMVEHCNKTENE